MVALGLAVVEGTGQTLLDAPPGGGALIPTRRPAAAQLQQRIGQQALTQSATEEIDAHGMVRSPCPTRIGRGPWEHR